MTAKVLKNLLLVTALALPAMLGILLAAFFITDDARIIGWLAQRIESASGTRISYSDGGSISNSLWPTLSLQNLEVTDEDQGFTFQTRSLDIQVSLPDLLLGRLDIPFLGLGASQVTVSDNKAGGADSGSWFKNGVDLSALRFKPVIHQVNIASVAVTLDEGSWQLAASQVSEINLQLQAQDDIPSLSAEFDIVGQVMHIDASLPDFHRASKRGKLPFSVNVTGPLASSALVGEVDFSGKGTVLQARLHSHAKDLSRIPLGIEGLEVPGALTLEAELSGEPDTIVANLEAVWAGPSNSRLTLDGQIGDVFAGEKIDLKLAGLLNETGWLQTVLPDSLPVSAGQVNAGITGSVERLQLQDLALKAQTSESLVLELNGNAQLARDAGGRYAAENIDARFTFQAPTTRAARFLVFEQVPEFGAITCVTDVKSDRGSPRLENIDLKTASENGIRALLSGGIGTFPLDASPNRNYDLKVAITADRAETVIKSVDLDLPLDGPMRLDFEINGDTPALQLNDIALNAGSRKAVTIKANGFMHFGDWSLANPLQSITMDVEADSQTTTVFGKLVNADGLPELGALTLKGRVRTADGTHRIENISLKTAKNATVQAALTGKADDLVLFPEPAVNGVALNLGVSGNNTADLNSLLGLDHPWIPAAGGFEAGAVITGSDKNIAIDRTHIVAGSKAVVQVSVTGRLGDVSANTDWALYNSRLEVSAVSDSSQALADAMGYRLPALGPLQAGGLINTRGRRVELSDVSLTVGANPDSPEIAVRGGIGDMLAFKDVDVAVDVAIDGHSLAGFADRRALEDLAPLTGDLQINDKTGALGVQSLKLDSSHENLSLAIEGRFPDFNRPETLSLQAGMKARDLALVGALFDQDWPAYAPFELQSDIGRDGQRLSANTVVRAGKKSLETQLYGNFNGERPRVAGKLTANELSVPDFYEKAAERRKQRLKEKGSEKEPVFSRDPLDFEILKKFDLALTVDIPTFERGYLDAKSAQLTISLKNGLLRVSPGVLGYPKGHLDITLVLDVSGKRPEVSYTASGNNLNPWLDLKSNDTKSGPPLQADMDIDIRLESSGGSPHELVSNLDGEVYTTIRDGKMRRSFTDLLFVDIVGWTASVVRDERFINVNCGIADLEISQGMVSTRAFFIDTPSITITGKGSVDLGKESVDYVFVPKKKSRIILKAEPVKVTGSLGDPTVRAIPVKSAALTLGTLVFAPYVFVGITAADYLSGKLNGEHKGVTPCLTYEKGRSPGEVSGTLPAQPSSEE